VKRLAQLSIEEMAEGAQRVLRLRGSADILCLSAVQEVLARYAREKIKLLLIDLSETAFINSPVWAAITLFARKQGDAARVAIVGMSDRIRGSFEMMGLQRELATYPSVELARRDLGLNADE
jgi:anti-anti-sigma factor